jgi:hypothetical protein
MVYFTLRNLNDKSSLIIYHCPIKPTMEFYFITRRYMLFPLNFASNQRGHYLSALKGNISY